MMGSAIWFSFGILLLGVTLPGQALAITVTSLNDSGPGSLRQAIADAPAGGTIDFAVTGTIVLTSGQLVITNDVTVSGPGTSALTLSQDLTNRILVVSNGNVTLSNLTIANGKCLGYEDGGGIKNLATLTLRNCLVASNYANYAGGGVFNQGDLTIRDSLIISNVAGQLGGGIANAYGGVTTIIGSTICSNSVGPFSGFITAGGIHNGGYLVISNSTVSGNQQYGIMDYGGTIVVSSSTVANNQQGDLAIETLVMHRVTLRNSIIKSCGGGTYTSEDYNLIQTHSLGYNSIFNGATNHNIYGQDPNLGPLAANGGPTPTHALRFDSPAIDAGHSGSTTTDQRGMSRPIDDPSIPNADGGDGSDIGAYEADPVLKVSSIEVAGASVRVGFNSVLGWRYRLESKTNLDDSWATNLDAILGTGGASQAVNAGTATAPQQFYRVRLVP